MVGEGITARFEGSLGQFRLAVSFQAPNHGITGLFGPSGCGKTSVLRCMAGLNRVRGYLCIGNDVWQDENHFRPVHQRPIGYVFQEASLFAHLSVRSNLTYGQRRAMKRGGSNSVPFEEVVELLGLSSLLDRESAHLSGGERQRVAIGRALLSQPRLLLMDEPLAALDRFSKEEILPYLERLRDTLDIPVFYVSHDIAEVERLADNLVLMSAGAIQAMGPLGELLSSPDLPLARMPEAAMVLDGVVDRFDPVYGLTEVRLKVGQLLVSGNSGKPGSPRRVKVVATDVSLGRHPPVDTSILNSLPARVRAFEFNGPHQVTVFIALGENGEGDSLLARISHKSWDTLGLQPGDLVHARIKAVTLAEPRRH
ncbi:MAG: molybdenum ABC transporter ATP-binding protein [Gammaproteobacteria bacterium]|nr:molybdenum ABC transporter ATP-binding protein [Gammaproteobacteria bacterium]MCP5458087.1 molybdenum ABC transporter ATP-binding protein [Gammaproteobacteria bacterium]